MRDLPFRSGEGNGCACCTPGRHMGEVRAFSQASEGQGRKAPGISTGARTPPSQEGAGMSGRSGSRSLATMLRNEAALAKAHVLAAVAQHRMLEHVNVEEVAGGHEGLRRLHILRRGRGRPTGGYAQ